MARKFDDAGETVLGARKHDFGRNLTLTDIEGISPEEAAGLVVKDRVWPVPDWKAMIAAGAAPEVMALVKIIRDRTPVQPNLDSVSQSGRPGDDVRADFIRMVTLIRERTEALRTLEDAKRLMSGILATVGWDDARPDQAVYDMLATVMPRKALSFKVGKMDVARAKVMVEAGFPESVTVPAWRRGVTFHQQGDGKLYAKRGGLIVGRDYDDEEAGYAGLEQAWKDTKAKGKEGPQEPPDRARLDKLERHGLPDRRDGADISPERFIEAFGFRGIQFGESMTDRERQTVVNMAFDALHDLADVTGLPPSAISLNGFLAASFGARGKGGKPAHYEPSQRIFNLGRARGAGSLAHEWAHAFDHAMGEHERETVSRGQIRYVSETGGMHLPMKASSAWVRLMENLMVRNKTREEAAAFANQAVTRTDTAITNQQARRDKLSTDERAFMNNHAIAEIDKWMEQAVRRRAAFAQRVEEIAEMASYASFGEVPTDFYSEAVRLCGKSGDYWKRPRELFARAFECAVYDRIESMGAVSHYLVHSVAGDLYADPDAWKGNPYPSAGERRLFEDAVFDVLAESVPLLDVGAESSPTPM